AEQHLGLIFEEFFRIDSSSSSSDKGLGLGLSIVDRSARMLGHPLAVRSRQGRGSVFELSLDRVPASGLCPADLIALPDAEILAGAFVAVVDDDVDNRAAIRDVLQGWRCLVLDAKSCDDIVAASAEHLRMPDLIVTDFRLEAHRDGFEVIDRLRGL